MLRRSLFSAAAILLAGVSAPALPAAADPDPAAFINDLGSQLQIVVMISSPEQRRAEFRRLFHDDFDVPALGRFVLGRFARILTLPQQQEFLALFENYVVATYSSRLTEYVAGGVVPRVIGSRLDQDGAIVSSEFIRGKGLASEQRTRRRVPDQRYRHRRSQHGRQWPHGARGRGGTQRRAAGGHPRSHAPRDGKRDVALKRGLCPRGLPGALAFGKPFIFDQTR